MKIVASVQAKRGSSRGLVHYIAHSKLDVEREHARGRELFNSFADSLSVESANNSLKIGIGKARPSNEELHHLVLSLRPEDYRALGRDEKERLHAVKEVTRAAMSRLEDALGADRLSWAAAVHLNTGNPHVHVALQKQYFTKEIEKGFLAKIPRDALPHYEFRDGEKILAAGLLIEAAVERIYRNQNRVADPNKDEVRQVHLPPSSDRTDRGEVPSGTADERDILRRGFLADYELQRFESKISELVERGDRLKFFVSDPQTGRKRRLSLHDLRQRTANSGTGEISPPETQIRTILLKMLTKEETAKAALHRETADTIREANQIKERYRKNDWKLPVPSFTKDELDTLQDYYIQTSNLRRFSYLESVRSDLERSGEIGPRDKKSLGRIAAKKTISDLRDKVYAKSWLDFRDTRYYRRVEIGHKSVSLAQLDREANSARQADLSFVNKLKKSVSRLSGKKVVDIAVEVENHSLRGTVITKLNEQLDAIKKGQKSEHKKVSVFEKILTDEIPASSVKPIYSFEELAEIEALSSHLKLRSVYEENRDEQRALIEGSGNECAAYRRLLKADPSADSNEYKRSVIGGRALARQIVAKVELDKSKEDLRIFTEFRRFQKFAIPDTKTGEVLFLSLHDVDPPRRGSVFDRAINELFESREHRRLRRTVTSFANAKEQRLKEDLYGAQDIFASASREAAEFAKFSFLGIRSKAVYPPIFTPSEIAAIEIRVAKTSDPKEATRLNKLLETTADHPSHSLKDILRAFENTQAIRATDRGPDLVEENHPDRIDNISRQRQGNAGEKEGRNIHQNTDHHAR